MTTTFLSTLMAEDRVKGAAGVFRKLVPRSSLEHLEVSMSLCFKSLHPTGHGL